ncbi:DNA -binding domain-containing protein [Paracoccus versutus]|jgi:hypothetical protein
MMQRLPQSKDRVTAMAREFQDQPPAGDEPTSYDREQLTLYLRLLDADRDGAGWQEAFEIIFGIDPSEHPERAEKVFTSHLDRAKWLASSGYLELLIAGRG